ncbi:MAG: hypothetical protein V7K25_06975 [Nostoc sp.]|uniref:hypothetical protein n=1 Tax=Nostoc sp. TaxID=1180 RepID=UPI002FFA50D0
MRLFLCVRRIDEHSENELQRSCSAAFKLQLCQPSYQTGRSLYDSRLEFYSLSKLSACNGYTWRKLRQAGNG